MMVSEHGFLLLLRYFTCYNALKCRIHAWKSVEGVLFLMNNTFVLEFVGFQLSCETEKGM